MKEPTIRTRVCEWANSVLPIHNYIHIPHVLGKGLERVALMDQRGPGSIRDRGN